MQDNTSPPFPQSSNPIDTWNVWSKHVLLELERNSKCGEDVKAKVTQMDNSVIRLETRLADVFDNFNQCKANCTTSCGVLEKKIDSLTATVSSLSNRVESIEGNLQDLNTTVMGKDDSCGLKSKVVLLTGRFETLQYMVYGIYAFLSSLILAALGYFLTERAL